jgi:hypothetical protein
MAAKPARKPRPKSSGGGGMGGFYRLCRMLHAYLSAFAFLALIFFSVTGLTLNHPEWLAGRRPAERTVTVAVPVAEVQKAMEFLSPERERVLAAAVGRRTPLVGAFASGEVFDDEALLRLEGPAGVSDVTLSLRTGEAEVSSRRATAVSLLNDLHKGKATAAPWKLLIDVSAGLFILLSVIGYVLFFSLRFRLPLSLILTGVSLLVMLATFVLFVA